MSLKGSIQRLAGWKAMRRIYSALGGVPVVGRPLRRLAHAVIPAKTRIWVRIPGANRDGLWAHLDPRFEMNYAEGKYEPKVQAALTEHLRAGSVFYDVGAHIGVESMLAARLVGERGTVFAFEADPENAARIEEHARRNQLHPMQIVPRAVWSSSGRLKFARASAESSRNQGAVAEPNGASGEDFIEVEAIALDEFARQNAPPTLIKIDVEGAEVEVLRGSADIFSAVRPAVICEVHHARAAEEVIPWLRERGYTTEWLEESSQFPRHLLAKWKA